LVSLIPNPDAGNSSNIAASKANTKKCDLALISNKLEQFFGFQV